ncbi:SMI1/KNR4 family protein [Streptomyces sp. H34-S4]|uniref:SMI1/KNR4 family protein n=1 Tax=Streptomyces sp. H34-S4 TaxID=2996463 RepID=UPI00226FA972|nr:SMI1/KNR4 family protein [Streptomyces sp. H34-S4]MCY0939521.1 hypothetical protein [Streptomyces sp. H34-S4]
MTLRGLEEALPPLLPLKSTADRGVDWAVIFDRLGVRLPGDFVDLANRYQTFTLGDFLVVQIPNRGGEQDFVSGKFELLEDLDSLSDPDEPIPYPLHPKPGGLIPWGASREGDYFYWRAIGDDPNSWPVVVFGSNDDWCEIEKSMTGYLEGLISGSVEPYGLPSSFPGRSPRVDF